MAAYQVVSYIFKGFSVVRFKVVVQQVVLHHPPKYVLH